MTTETPTTKPPKKKYTQQPAYYMSDEAKEAAIDELNDRRLHAMSDAHELKANDGWKVQQDLWEDLDDDGRKSAVYAMVMSDGAVKIPLILKYFTITKAEFEPYKQVHDMACAALALKVQRNQMSMFFSREDLVDGKYFLGRQFAGQVQNPAHEDAPSVDENSKSPTIVFTESTGLAPEKRAEFEAAIASAMATGKVKKLK